MQRFLVKAPTRVDLAGGTLDLWPLYTLHTQTKTINCAIDLFAQAEFIVEPSNQCKISVKSPEGELHQFAAPLTQEMLAKVSPALRFPVAIVSRYIEQRKELPKFSMKIQFKTEAPLRSGLGGSSSLCVALTRGLNRVFNEHSEQGWQFQVLNWVKDLEAGFLRTPTGTQDYLAALFGGVNSFSFSTGTLHRHPFSAGVFEQLQERVSVLFSGEMHHSGLSNWEIYRGAIEGRGDILAGLKEIKRIADLLDKELRKSSIEWPVIGKLLNDEWDTRKTMFRVETPRLEEIIHFLKEQNIHGARVCGAAAGGSLIVLVDPQEREALQQACAKNGIQVLKTTLTQEGVTTSELP